MHAWVRRVRRARRARRARRERERERTVDHRTASALAAAADQVQKCHMSSSE